MSVPRIASIGQVCKIIGGGTPSRTNPEFFGGNIPWATVKDFKCSVILETQEFITDAAVVASATNVVPPRTVLLVSRIGLGKVAIAGIDLAINQDVKALTPREDVLPEYLYWFLLSKASHFVRIGVGATVKGITLDDIKSVEIPIPTIQEQEQIVDLLSSAESIVRLRREAQRKAAELAPAIFLNMFGDPAMNQKGLPMAFLGDHVMIESSVKTPNFDTDADLPCMGADSIESMSGRLIFMPSVRDVLPKSGKYWFDAGDVLYSKIRPYLAKAVLVSRSGYCSADIYPLRCGRTLRPAYLLSLLLSKAFTEYATGESVRASMPKLNREALFRYQFPLPPLELQDRFVERYQAVISVEEAQRSAFAKASAVFESMLASNFSV